MKMKTGFTAGWIHAAQEMAAVRRTVPAGLCEDSFPASLSPSPEHTLSFKRSSFRAVPTDKATSGSGKASSLTGSAEPDSLPAPSVLPSLKKGSRSFLSFLQWFAVLFLPGGAVGVLWIRGRLRLTPDFFTRMNKEPSPEKFDKLLSYSLRLTRWAGMPIAEKEESSWAARAEADGRFARFRRFLYLMEKHRARRGSLSPEEYREAADIVASARRACLASLKGFPRWRFLFLKKL